MMFEFGFLSSGNFSERSERCKGLGWELWVCGFEGMWVLGLGVMGLRLGLFFLRSKNYRKVKFEKSKKKFFFPI